MFKSDLGILLAAFINIGTELNAFLPFSEIGSDEYLIEENEGKRNRNNKNGKYDNIEVDLKKDQEICVLKARQKKAFTVQN